MKAKNKPSFIIAYLVAQHEFKPRVTAIFRVTDPDPHGSACFCAVRIRINLRIRIRAKKVSKGMNKS